MYFEGTCLCHGGYPGTDVCVAEVSVWMRRVRSASQDGSGPDDWFNMFVLHQNRVAHSQSAKNLIKDSQLARWLDLVVWGHEHECVPELQVRAGLPWRGVKPRLRGGGDCVCVSLIAWGPGC